MLESRAGFFNTSVEMRVRIRRRNANGPLFMRGSPFCTGGDAGVNIPARKCLGHGFRIPKLYNPWVDGGR